MNGKILAVGATLVVVGLIMLAPILVISIFDSATGFSDITGQAIAEPAPENASIVGWIYAIIGVGIAVVALSFFFSPSKAQYSRKV